MNLIRYKLFLLRMLARVDEPYYTLLNGFLNAIIRWRIPERVTHPGILHPDKTFYIIRDLPPDTGLASWYDRVLGYALHAERKGWIPIIDELPPPQPDDGNWYVYFKGLSDIPVKDALQGCNVVYATKFGAVFKRYSKRNVARRHRLCIRIPFSDEAQAFIDSRIDAFLGERELVGVFFRGTDFRTSANWCPVGHAKVPSYEEFCTQVSEDLRRWHIPENGGAHLFVVTEEEEALTFIRMRFPRCRFIVKERHAKFDFKGNMLFHRLPKTTPRENNFLYLLDLVLLSRCDYLIGALCGGVLAALNMNGNRYRGVDILKTGVS